MQVDETGGFQHPAHLDEADGHVGQVGGVPIGMGIAGGVDHFGRRLVLLIELVQPFLVNIFLPFPDVGEPGGGIAVPRPFDARHLRLGPACDSPVGQGALLQGQLLGRQGRFQVAGEVVVLGEGRVGDDQIHRFVVQGCQNFQVVGDHHSAVQRVRPRLRGGHWLSVPCQSVTGLGIGCSIRGLRVWLGPSQPAGRGRIPAGVPLGCFP